MVVHTNLPAWLQPTCANQHMLSFVSGMAVAVTGLDRLFAGYGAPAGVHWALGGFGADFYCKGKFAPDQDTALCLASGFGGGWIATALMRGTR